MPLRHRGPRRRGPALNLRSTAIEGAYVIEPELLRDDRGFFARTFCAGELASRGLDVAVSQCSVSFNHAAGTLRGMHYQVEPDGEAKLVRCTRGRIFDALVDLRRESPTYGAVVTRELGADNLFELFAPRGVAHGFLTLAPDTEVLYQISTPYRPEAGRGVRWNDPRAGIPWPFPPAVISDRDANYPDFDW